MYMRNALTCPIQTRTKFVRYGSAHRTRRNVSLRPSRHLASPGKSRTDWTRSEHCRLGFCSLGVLPDQGPKWMAPAQLLQLTLRQSNLASATAHTNGYNRCGAQALPERGAWLMSIATGKSKPPGEPSSRALETGVNSLRSLANIEIKKQPLSTLFVAEW
ncbi:hypothetical protein J6590_091403 [Homalodisca vitripennis]|nr:hypothetical protein J6590_091403 [Homalodisca vitripennis]